MSLSENIQTIKDRLLKSAARAHRDSSEITLIAVSKKQPAELIRQAYGLGLRDFGENYVQELQEKQKALSDLHGIRWHLIGHLQSNKAKIAVQLAHTFHAVDSEKLAKELSKRAIEAGRVLPVFIEVNIDGEESKAGVRPEDCHTLVEAVTGLPSLKLQGLMAIPSPENDTRMSFKRLRELALSQSQPLQLSMGMSGDFEAAIEEGSHYIRVGTAIFGERS